MRRYAAIGIAAVVAAACSDSGIAPTSPDGLPPTIRASQHIGSGSDGCMGLSPCDAYLGYWHGESLDQSTSPPSPWYPGAFITSPGVNNHKPFTGTFVPGLGATAVGAQDGQLQVYSCPITNSPYPPDTPQSPEPPTVDCAEQSNPNNPDFRDGKFRWDDPVRGANDAEFYVTHVQFKLTGKKPEIPPSFRLYMTAGDRILVHRDISLCSSGTSPADAGVYCAGTGTVPFKAYVGSDLGCTTSDANGEFGSQESAVCLIAGDVDLTLQGPDPEISASLSFDDQSAIDAFIAEFNLTECESLGPRSQSGLTFGGASMDLRFLGCALRIDAPTDAELTNAATVTLNILENDCNAGQCVVVLQDEQGQSMLPAVVPPVSMSPLRELIGSGLNKLAALVRAKPLVATAVGGSLTGGFRRLSDIQAAVGTVVDFPSGFGNACDPVSGSCRDLGVVAGPTPVRVRVTNPATSAPNNGIPGVRVHFFPDDDGTNVGTAACVTGFACTEPGDGPDPTTGPAGSQTSWSPQTVVITDGDGYAEVDWTLGAGGQREMNILVCGGAIPGSVESTDPELDSDTPLNDALPPWQNGDFVWGVLQTCDRDPADEDASPRYPATDPAPLAVDANGWANGPDTGLDAFDPNFISPVDFEVAANDLSLTVLASGCPAIDVTDGKRLGEWPLGCVAEYVFTANTTGNSPDNNASLLWRNDGDYLYVAIEVRDAQAKDLNDAFFYFDNDATGSEQLVDGVYDGATEEFDDIVVMRVDETPVTKDWWTTANCAGSPKASLCGSPDSAPNIAEELEGAADVDTDGDLFWEFRKKLRSDSSCGGANPDGEDFCLAAPDYVGSSWTITGGQGGGKGGTSAPDGGGFLLIQIE